jgi:hypothetical protein
MGIAEVPRGEKGGGRERNRDRACDRDTWRADKWWRRWR